MSRQITSVVGGSTVAGGDAHADVNPSDLSDVVLEYGALDADTARSALEAAAAAFPLWSHTTPWERSTVLDRAGTEVLARADELGDLLAREEGKTLPEAKGEVVRAGQILKYFAGAVLQPSGHVLDSVRPGIEVSVTREPIGVVSVITPWNFPIAIPAWKIAPALAYGNTVVFKPAELVPGSAWELVDILNRAGLPRGRAQPRAGPRVRGRPGAHDRPARQRRHLHRLGLATGRGISATPRAAGRKVQLELGGKNPLVIVDDADLATAVEVLVQGGFGSTGQRCTASSYAVVTDAIHDRLVEAVQERLTRWTVGDARAAGIEMGPVVDPSQLAQDQRYLDVARREGGEVIGGDVLDLGTAGHYMAPALVLGTKATDTINVEEVFGPVVSVVRVSDYGEALATANASTMNLSAGVVTTDLATATHFRRSSKAGMVMVNLPTAGVDFHVPFGGRGDSSHGPREQGFAAIDFFTTSKTAYTSPGLPRN